MANLLNSQLGERKRDRGMTGRYREYKGIGRERKKERKNLIDKMMEDRTDGEKSRRERQR